jgi:hypothetical protein
MTLMSAKFCCTCIHWEKDIFTRVGEKFGICHDVVAPGKIVMDTNTTLNDETILYTEEYYGCIYWRENDGSLLNFKYIINKNTGKPIDDNE